MSTRRILPARPFVALVAVVAALALVAAACGDDDGTATDAPATADGSTGGDDAGGSDGADPATAPEAPADAGDGADPASSIPDVQMLDVSTGETVGLAAALASTDGRPSLAWFWAPYCPTCRGEAPVLDEFMADNGDRVNLVGVGTQNDLSRAEEFLEDTGVTNFPLLWEDSGASWAGFGVTAQPYLILLDADGEVVMRWPGGAGPGEILTELDKLA